MEIKAMVVPFVEVCSIRAEPPERYEQTLAATIARPVLSLRSCE